MAEDLTFTIPGSDATTVTTAAETVVAPVIDPATGEPTLAPPETPNPEPITVVEPKSEPVVPDKDSVALAAAARSSYEARTANKKLADAQKEIESLKASGGNVSAVQAELDAIKKDPSLLFKHGWDADKLMKKILDPSSTESPEDIEARIEAKLQAKLDAALKPKEKTAEEIAAQERANNEVTERGMVSATARTAELIKAESENYFWVDADDARGIVEQVVKFCNKEKFEPTPEQGKALVMQGIKGLHEKRSNRDFAKRVAKTTGDAQNRSQSEGIDFTVGSSKPQQTFEPKPTATTKTPQSNGHPLPTRKPTFELGFTGE